MSFAEIKDELRTEPKAAGNNNAANPASEFHETTGRNIRVFPESAWSGPFRQWRDIVAPCTEAALENLWAGFLVAVGLIIGRSAWKECPRPIYPNFFVLLMGSTGDARKSTVLWLVEQLLHFVGAEIEIIRGIVSTEGIFERLAKKEGTLALGYADEFRALLHVAKRKGTGDLLPKLNSLYSCPERESIDRRKESTIVVRPFFSLITATPRSYVDDLLGNAEITGGLLNRFITLAGAEQDPKPFVKSPSQTQWELIAAPLRKVLSGKTGELDFDAEAAELWGKFYTTWRISRRTWDQQATELSARTFEHVLKIAIVYSVLNGDRVINARSLATAIAIGGWLQQQTLTSFADVGLDSFAKGEAAILEIVKERGWIYRRDLQQRLSKKLNGETFARVLKSLEANGHVFLGKKRSASGQSRSTVEGVGANT